MRYLTQIKIYLFHNFCTFIMHTSSCNDQIHWRSSWRRIKKFLLFFFFLQKSTIYLFLLVKIAWYFVYHLYLFIYTCLAVYDNFNLNLIAFSFSHSYSRLNSSFFFNEIYISNSVYAIPNDRYVEPTVGCKIDSRVEYSNYRREKK